MSRHSAILVSCYTLRRFSSMRRCDERNVISPTDNIGESGASKQHAAERFFRSASLRCRFQHPATSTGHGQVTR